MSLEQISTDTAPAAIGPYSQAIAAAGWVASSGQIGMDPQTGELIGGGVEAQASQALANLAAVLSAAGSDLSLVMKTTLYLIDMNDFAAVNEIYARVFGDARPARATVAVCALPKGALFEIDALALKRS